jgi:curved DNA-binding protein CbpA
MVFTPEMESMFMDAGAKRGSIFHMSSLDSPSTRRKDWQEKGMMETDNSSSNLLRTRTLSGSSLLLSDSDAMNTKSIRSTIVYKERESVPRIPEVNPYRILGMRRNATQAEIRNAYIRLALLNHPHRGHPQSEKLEFRATKLKDDIYRWKFIVIAASYETLSCLDHRTNYNFANRDSSPKNWGNREGRGSLWDGIKKDIKRGLKISESNEEELDHDGVPCCNISILCTGMKPSPEARDDSESIKTFTRRGLNLLQIRPLMMRDDSDKSDPCLDDDAARVETNQLFGGPLSAMYKARNHEPFTDAFILFERISCSAIFRYDSEFKHYQASNDADEFDLISHNWLMTTPTSRRNSAHSVPFSSEEMDFLKLTSSGVKGIAECNDEQCYPSLPPLPMDVLKSLCSEFAPLQNSFIDLKVTKTKEAINGEIVEVAKKCRFIGNERMVRTERVSRDSRTGQMKKIIEVRRQPAVRHDESENTFTSCMPQSFFELIASSLDIHNFTSLGFEKKARSDRPNPVKLVATFDSRQDEAGERE